MAVYVDDMEAPFRKMVMCHMIALVRQHEDGHHRVVAGLRHQWGF